MKKLYSVLLFFLSVTLFGQAYTFTTYNTNNSGIAANNVNDLKQSSTGTIWIATNDGLSAMVGNTFTNYRTSNSTIAGNMIYKLATHGSNVWATTPQQGLIYRNGNTGAFSNYRMDNSGIPNNVIDGIAVDGQGTLWMASSSGLTKYNGTTWVTYNTTNSQINSNNVTSVAVDASNTVWISANGSLQRFNNNNFTSVNDQVEKILKIAGNTIYVATPNGFGTIVGTEYTGFYQPGGNSCLAGCDVQAVGVDELNRVWLGLDMCGNYEGAIQNFTDCTTYRSSNSPLPDNNITSIHVIDSNVIWAGTLEGGLVKMNKSDACNAPTNMAVNPQSLSHYGVQLTWTAANPVPSGYTYYYNTVNTVGGTAGQTSETNVWIDGLQPNTTYYWWVSSACTQNWVPAGSFTTLAAPVPTTCFRQIDAGATHTVGIKTDGTLWAWGNNDNGQLGTGNTTNQATPRQIGTGTDWKFVSTSLDHTVAIKTDGTLWAWGSNANGRLGNGVSSIAITSQPVQIGTATNWKSVATGEGHTVAVKTNGTLWAWGFNVVGQVGDGSTTDVVTPVQIGTATSWQQVYAGAYSSYAIRNTGTLYAWGINTYGQLGDGTTTAKTVPTQIAINNILSFAAGGFHVVVVKGDGSLWTWGSNERFQIGDGTVNDRLVPTRIGTLNTWMAAGAGDTHSMAIRTDGSLYTWGLGTNGQTGVGGATNKMVPTYVSNNGWTAVTGGYYHTAALYSADSKLAGFGSNSYGQIGETGFTQSNVPTFVACPVSASTCNPPTNLNVNTQELTATTVSLQWTAPTPAPAGYNFVYNTVNQIGGTDGYTQGTGAWIEGLTPNTTYYWWVASACTPQQWVAGGSFTTPAAPADTTCFVQIASGVDFSAGVKADGTLWTWGNNTYGQLGIGNITSQFEPRQVGTATNWKFVATGLYHTMALKTDGTLWAWGRNNEGRLGTGPGSDNVLTPVQIGTAANWKTVAGGRDFTIALKTDGTLWAWGSNAHGQIGDNTTTSRLTPRQIGTATHWKEVYTTRGSSHAVTNNGTLWSWGDNSEGQLGVGGINNMFVPTVTSMTNVQAFAAGAFHAMAIKTNGTLWVWGSNEQGQLGNNTTSNAYTPIQIGNNETWKVVGAGIYHSMAVNTNNMLYTWGLNSNGQLGINSTTNKWVPTAANMDGVIAVTGGENHTLALQEGGHLSSVGRNQNGQLANPQYTQTITFISVDCPTSASASTDEFELSAMKVYPNPVSDVLNISLDREITAVSIFNLLGQQVIVKTVNANETTIDVSQLQSGAYFVKVMSGNEVKTSKIIKK